MASHVLPYDQWSGINESRQSLNENQIRFLDSCTDGTWKFDKTTGLVNVDGDFDFMDRGMMDFNGIKFGRVSGHFLCGENELTTLEGSPRFVGRNFDCYKNNLGDLEGAPQWVGGNFNATGNNLVSLEGAPEKVGGYFNVYGNDLRSLEGGPVIVGGDFNCMKNFKLQSLKGAPEKIGRSFESDFLSMPGSEWNIDGWLRELADANRSSSETLLLSIITPEAINQRMKESPMQMVEALIPFLNWRKFEHIWKGIEFPKELGDVNKLMARIQRARDIEKLI